MPTEENNQIKQEELKLLKEACSQYDVKLEHVRELMELEKSHRIHLRRSNIHKDMRDKIKNFVLQSD